MKIRKGVYLLLTNGTPTYVGQTRDLAHRIDEHIRGRNGCLKNFDSWDFAEIPDDYTRLRMESLLINYLKPIYNKKPGVAYQFIEPETDEEIERYRSMHIYLNARRIAHEQIDSDWKAN